ncbi:MAG: N-acetylmuramic acid 6-phosphate etherase [Rhodobacteraceae bacterium]|nr:MAG: N-acetylmuramic acid 6-phosphate etherase [Paracoccaceae bacterium]
MRRNEGGNHLHQGTDRPPPAIDALPGDEALSVMLASHLAAAEAVRPALPALARAADLVAATLGRGGALTYAAAGSSGLMALSDASELAGTFGIAPRQTRIEMAGGVPVDAVMPGDTEDDTTAAARIAAAMGAGDLAIVVSASGTTPYALAVAEAVRARALPVIAIANVARAPLLDLADVAIAIPTAPEVVEGSTRLGAGTAQKIALNMISTLAGVRLGHVHDGLMVNLRPDNIKLRARAAAIVSRITGVGRAAAEAALAATGHDTKCAVLVATGAAPDEARRLLSQYDNRLRPCLERRAASTD